MDNYHNNQSLLDGEDLREARIKARVWMYIRGTISLDEFYEMEKPEGDDIKANRQKELDRILDEIRKEKDQEEPVVSEDQAAFTMTRDEFNKLSLREQSDLFNRHPNEIRELLEPVDKSPVTRDQFLKMTLQEQNEYYKSMPEKIKALISGDLDSVERLVSPSQDAPSVGYVFNSEEDMK